ncbi:MAG: hypothetical protein AB7E08_06025 [Candidatus Omnitrophota bacterium]
MVLKNTLNSVLVVGNKRFAPQEEKTIDKIDTDIKLAIKKGFLVEIGGEQASLPPEEEKVDIDSYLEKHWKTLERQIKDNTDLVFLNNLLDRAKEINAKTTRNLGGHITTIQKRIEIVQKESEKQE